MYIIIHNYSIKSDNLRLYWFLKRKNEKKKIYIYIYIYIIYISIFTALKSNFYCKWWWNLAFQIPWDINTKPTNFTPGGLISCICYRLVAPQRLRFFSESPYDFDHYSLKSSRIFKTTTRAYKRTQNSIFSSRIASPFKKRNVTPPPTIPRTAPPCFRDIVLVTSLIGHSWKSVLYRPNGKAEAQGRWPNKFFN